MIVHREWKLELIGTIELNSLSRLSYRLRTRRRRRKPIPKGKRSAKAKKGLHAERFQRRKNTKFVKLECKGGGAVAVKINVRILCTAVSPDISHEVIVTTELDA